LSTVPKHAIDRSTVFKYTTRNPPVVEYRNQPSIDTDSVRSCYRFWPAVDGPLRKTASCLG